MTNYYAIYIYIHVCARVCVRVLVCVSLLLLIISANTIVVDALLVSKFNIAWIFLR